MNKAKRTQAQHIHCYTQINSFSAKEKNVQREILLVVNAVIKKHVVRSVNC